MLAKVESTVCDFGDGKSASGTITWRRNGTAITNDLCAAHMALLESNGHAPRRGRPKGRKTTRVTSKRTTSKRTTTSKKTVARKPTRKKMAAKKPRKLKIAA